ncbi:efflux RND transporter permease subunit [Pectobacterium actinidiae]|uniref:efflux RND transporter permease subunit n=1 Tax=Pectobacterium actinidiae TaxID=1507808 RepID=UPI0040409735
MNPSRPFIARPVATLLLALSVFIAGLVACLTLPVSALPQADYPVIQLTTHYPGASPAVISSTVTAPLERQLGMMSGLEQMYSSSGNGISSITLRFNLGLSLDVAQQEVQAAINAASRLLPDDLPMPPVYKKVNPADKPLVTLMATSQQRPLTEVQDLINTRIALKIAQLNGVGNLALQGGNRPAIRITLNQQALAARNLTLEDVRQQIAVSSLQSAKGDINGRYKALLLDTNDQLRNVEDWRSLILSWQDGVALRLKDVAVVENGAEDVQQAAWVNQQPAILITVQRQPDVNEIQVADAIRQHLPEWQASLPPDVSLTMLVDHTDMVRASVAGVSKELVFSVLLVVMVTFFFLRSFAATLVTGIVVPLSMAGTCVIMHFCGFSLNNFTLMALTVASGFIIDDAIVVVENISRWLERGMSRREAALKGTEEIGFTVISLTLSLVAVLVPLLFMEGIIGRLLREFSITLAVAILMSMIISLTLAPMLCAALLVPAGQHKSEHFFARLTQIYGRMLDKCLLHGRLTVLITVGLALLTILLYLLVPKSLFPSADTGVIQFTAIAQGDISYAEMSRRQQILTGIILQNPAVASVTSSVGVNAANSALNRSHIQVNLKPFSLRASSANQVVAQLKQAVGHRVDMQLYSTTPLLLTLNDLVAPGRYQFTLEGINRNELRDRALQLAAVLRHTPGLSDINSSADSQAKTVSIIINRDKAQMLGISVADIDAALYNAFGQRQIATLYTEANQYRVILNARMQNQDGISALRGVYLRTWQMQANGESSTQGMVPLSAVASLSIGQSTLVYERINQLTAITFSFNLVDGYSLQEALKTIQQQKAQLSQSESLVLRFQGEAGLFEYSSSSEFWLIAVAIFSVYVILGMLYESFLHPITILSTLPSALVGALLALWLIGVDYTLIVMIGMILLIGIVKKNAIMMIDFALQAQHGGVSAREAIHEACLLRFRPIMMTTFATLLGALPLMLASGEGAELRQPLGLVIISGLLVSQLLTLFSTPVIYLSLSRFTALSCVTRQQPA